jgi:hypothetical protein
MHAGCQVGYSNTVCADQGQTIKLDRDVTGGYGPETITMETPINGKYRSCFILVSAWAHRSSISSPARAAPYCRARSNAGPRPSSENVLLLFAAARAVLSVTRFFVHHFSGSDDVATSGAIVKECHTHKRLVCLRRFLSRRRGRVCAHTHTSVHARARVLVLWLGGELWK